MKNANRKQGLTSESYHIPSADADTHIYVCNTRPEGMTTFSAERTLLFVHGATYPSNTMFDLKIDGLSWMDSIAGHGYDVYSMDVRGFGRSTRPPEMDRPADENHPVVATDDGVTDLGAVVDHVRQRRGVARLNLMGWSWGTVIAGAYAVQKSDRVERLVMCSPLWLRDEPACAARAQRVAHRWVEILGSGFALLRSSGCPRARADGRRRVGCRHAGLYGTGDSCAADWLSAKTAGHHRRSDASSDARVEPPAAVPRGPIITSTSSFRLEGGSHLRRTPRRWI
jgi:pimeloyl-ACP methyl ester carboxylesterase